MFCRSFLGATSISGGESKKGIHPSDMGPRAQRERKRERERDRKRERERERERDKERERERGLLSVELD
jgi:hypothetical protein